MALGSISMSFSNSEFAVLELSLLSHSFWIVPKSASPLSFLGKFSVVERKFDSLALVCTVSIPFKPGSSF